MTRDRAYQTLLRTKIITIRTVRPPNSMFRLFSILCRCCCAMNFLLATGGTTMLSLPTTLVNREKDPAARFEFLCIGRRRMMDGRSSLPDISLHRCVTFLSLRHDGTTAATAQPLDAHLCANERDMSSTSSSLCSVCFGSSKGRKFRQTLLPKRVCFCEGVLSVCTKTMMMSG